MSVAGTLLRRARSAGFDYRCFHVMRLPLEPQTAPDVAPPQGFTFIGVETRDVESSSDAEIRDTAWYGGPGSNGFAMFRDGRIVCLQWIWHGERLERSGFWPFGEKEAVSVHLVTVPDERGRGLATELKRFTAARMRELGFVALYSRIWWTNRPSLRVSEKAGWARVGTTLSIGMPWRTKPVEWRWRRSERANG